MIKLRSITFKNHPILGNLHLDFTVNGNVVDTVIFAGENGVGKSTILKSIFALTDHNLLNKSYISELELENNNIYEKIEVSIDLKGHVFFNNGKKSLHILSDEFKLQYPFKVIYSDVGINYTVPKISTITSLDIDEDFKTIQSSEDTARMITQLLIDIDVLDAIEYRNQYEIAKKCGNDLNEFNPSQRMDRFKSAFEQMFTHIKWKGVVNGEGRKKVYFQVYNDDVELNDLSSGEKQIIFRGGLLLKNKDASRSAFILIDEPEISLHPDWQKKIMSFYKNIFTDNQGVQFSQIFAVTHSPFIIHNENRYNDKVIILKKDSNGKIYVEDKPSYYDCNAVKVVEDAFNIQDFSLMVRPTLYTEGRTDEKYLKKVAEVFELKLPFEIKWIGHIDASGQESNTGYPALNKAKEFLIAQGGDIKAILLYDCDTNKKDENLGHIFIRHLPKYENTKKINKGIENALVLDAINISEFYNIKNTIGDYGEEKNIAEFDKMACCDYLCGLGPEILKEIFANLQRLLESLINIFNEA